VEIKAENYGFKPVTIILESQNEVNELFAIFNFTPVLGPLKGMDSGFAKCMFAGLKKYRTSDYEDFHAALDSNWKQRRIFTQL
jgi:hypothetical protein